MILCLQSLFPTGTILLTTDAGEVRREYTWEKATETPNLIQRIAELLQAESVLPEEVNAFDAVQGPGPFTAVRTVAVIARTWQAEHPALQLNPIPSGVFLRRKFPRSHELILPAGKNAFFRFDPEKPERFTKYPLAEWMNLSRSCGGFFDSSWPVDFQTLFEPGLTDSETFHQFLQMDFEERETDFQPIYGAEANISGSS